MRLFPICLTIALTALVGCRGDSSADSSTAAELAAPETAVGAAESAGLNESDSNVVATDLPAAAATSPVGPTLPAAESEWLPLPETISPRLTTAYAEMAVAASSGDAMGQANLAMISQQIAMQLAQAEDEAQAFRFLAQSGKALRAAIAGNVEGLPEQMAGPVFFYEALALAMDGKTAAATDALNDAVVHGFAEFDSLYNDETFADVVAAEGFAEKLEAWKLIAAENAKKAIERLRQVAIEQLEAGTTFPFAFTASDINGVEQSLESLQGKVVIVDFWGTWCPPCRAEIPAFIQLQDKYGEQGFQMIGLNYEQGATEEANLKSVTDFVKEFGINYPCIMGSQEIQDQVPNLVSFPTTLFIDRAGQVRMKAVGQHPLEYLDAVVEHLLNE